MLILRTIHEVQAWSDEQRREGKVIGFVPTMGYLHAGHMVLVDAAVRDCDVVAASIFVNPTQFSVSEDLSRYPRDFERDREQLEQRGCTMIFAPTIEEMYPEGFATGVKVRGVTAVFEGAYRPTHFDGVALIVSKLFLCVKAHRVYMGQKDFQQTLVVRRLIRDLNIDIELIIVPTVREQDGLAMSSRNVFLSESDRVTALAISRALVNVQRAVTQGVRLSSTLDEIAVKTLTEARGLQPDYARCVMVDTLMPKERLESGDECVCLIAARVGTTRLIDNMTMTIP